MKIKIRSAAILLSFFLCCASRSSAATKVYLHAAASSVGGYKAANQKAGASLVTSVTNTAASGTNIQVTDTAGGSNIAWISEPLAAGVTLAGSATCNLWGKESATAANASFRCRYFRYIASEGAEIWMAQDSRELTASITNESFSAVPTSTAFNAGDRIVVKIFLENCSATSGCPTGTMAGGRTVTLDYDAGTGGADGDTYVQFTETLGFQYTASPTDTVSSSDSIAGIAGFGRGTTDTVSASDSISRVYGISRGVSETVSSSDSIARVYGANVGPSETNAGSDTISRLAAFDRASSDSVSSSDSISRVYGIVVGMSETASPSDSVSRIAALGVSIPESLSSSDSISRSAGFGALMSESVSGSDSVSRAAGAQRGVTEALSISDSASRLFRAVRGSSENLAASDAVEAAYQGGGSSEEPGAQIFIMFRRL